MDFSNFKTGQDDVSRRLDKVIRIFAEELTLPEIYKAIRKGLIKVNNRKTKADYRIQENDIISIATFLVKKNDDGNNKIIATNDKFDFPPIVFENDDILIINKPYDINVHGDNKSLDKLVEKYVNIQDNDSLSFKPGPLHRLDRKTTGLLAFSKSLKGAHWFTENIQNHNIKKIYWGLVEGSLSKEENWTDLVIPESESGDGFHKVVAKKISNADARGNLDNPNLAKTTALPIAHGNYSNKPVTLVRFDIKTGRKHQIRAQSSLHKHPLLGDTSYGGTKLNSAYDFYLTAKELYFPKDNPLALPEKLEISLPQSFILFLKSCGIKKIDV